MKHYPTIRGRRVGDTRPLKSTYLVKFLTYCRGTYEWEMLKIKARNDRDACLLTSAMINYHTSDVSVLEDDEDFDTGEYVVELTNSQLLKHLRQLNEEQGVYYMENLTTGKILIDDTAEYKKECGENFEANTDISDVMWDED